MNNRATVSAMKKVNLQAQTRCRKSYEESNVIDRAFVQAGLRGYTFSKPAQASLRQAINRQIQAAEDLITFYKSALNEVDNLKIED